jgi:hypothetical protein
LCLLLFFSKKGGNPDPLDGTERRNYVNCHFLLAQKVTMLRPAARHQLLQLSNHPDRSGGFVREKTRFSILQKHTIWFACSLSGFSKPISCQMIRTNSVSSLPEIAFVQLRQFSLTVCSSK